MAVSHLFGGEADERAAVSVVLVLGAAEADAAHEGLQPLVALGLLLLHRPHDDARPPIVVLERVHPHELASSQDKGIMSVCGVCGECGVCRVLT